MAPQECFDRYERPANGALFTGAAGVAFFLHEVARVTGDSDALKQGGEWCRHAETVVASAPPDPQFPNAEHAVFTGQAGRAYTKILLSALSGDDVACAKGIDGFLEAWHFTEKMGDSMPLDIIFGAAGFTCASHDILSRCHDLKFSRRGAVQDVASSSVKYLVQSLERPLPDRAGALTTLAHGIAGELFACFVAKCPRELLNARLDEFLQLSVSEPPLVLWPRAVGSPDYGFGPASWCNGIAGITVMLCRAAEYLESQRLFDVACRAAFTSFRFRLGSNNPGVCCGTAGQALAIAMFARVSKDRMFLQRAKSRLRQAIDDADNLRLETLWQGRLGIALAALIARSGPVFFPVIESPD